METDIHQLESNGFLVWSLDLKSKHHHQCVCGGEIPGSQPRPPEAEDDPGAWGSANPPGVSAAY